MEVSNPGLEGFDTVLGGLFGLGGGGDSLHPHGTLWRKTNIVKPGRSQIRAKSGVSGGFGPRFRWFI